MQFALEESELDGKTECHRSSRFTLAALTLREHHHQSNRYSIPNDQCPLASSFQNDRDELVGSKIEIRTRRDVRRASSANCRAGVYRQMDI